MASSFNDFVGDGSQTIFNINFGYLDREHVSVLVEAVSTAFTWVSDSTISITPAPALGDNIRVLRTTPSTVVIDFQDGETLTEEKLDNVNLQSLYVAQEAADNLGTTIVADASDGNYDFNARRIKNVADPVDPGDAVNKDWAENEGSSFVSQAGVSASEAGASATAAAVAAAAADASRIAAANSETAADTSETNAAASAAAAAASAASAASEAGNAVGSAFADHDAEYEWYDRTANRSSNVTYQNVTNFDRLVVIRGYNNATNVRNLEFSADGVTWWAVDGLIGGSVGADTASFVVGPGEYYRMNLGNVTSTLWLERDF